MSRRTYGLACGAVLAAVAVAAGCGGSDSSSSSDTVATTPETTQTTGATTGNARLTTSQWSEYQTSRAALRKADTAASATLKKCSSIAVNQKPTATQACVGDVFTELTTAAGNSLTTLKSFQGSVSGSCATALDTLIGQVGIFQASAHAMQAAIDSPTLAGYPSASQNLEIALTSGKNEAATFEKECAPA